MVTVNNLYAMIEGLAKSCAYATEVDVDDLGRNVIDTVTPSVITYASFFDAIVKYDAGIILFTAEWQSYIMDIEGRDGMRTIRVLCVTDDGDSECIFTIRTDIIS